MKLTRTERWVLSNQLQILQILDPDNQDDYKSTQKIIERGFEYLYDNRIQHINSDDQTMSESECILTIEILSMFRGITYSLEKIDDTTGINLTYLKFAGFDGNNEGKYLDFAFFFCNEFDDERFSEIGKGIDNFNSHLPMLDAYLRMLEVWNTSKNKYELTREELIRIGEAFVHPDNR